jgi:hypothetical protein
MMHVQKRVMLAGAAAFLCATAVACGGDNAGKAEMQAAADSMTKQRDSAMAKMDSAGVIHTDSARRDTTRHDSTTKKKKPS